LQLRTALGAIVPATCHFVYADNAIVLTSTAEKSGKNLPISVVFHFTNRFCPANAEARLFPQGRIPRRNSLLSEFVGFCPEKSIFSPSSPHSAARRAAISCMLTSEYSR
jgi:hypothetical protein